MLSWLCAYRLPLAAAAAIAACLLAASPNFRFSSGPNASPYAGDFLQEWIGGWIVRAGDRDRLYDWPYAYALQHDAALVGFVWNDDQYLPLVYPPFYYVLVSPLSLLSVRAAAWIWAALMLAALVASGTLMDRALRDHSSNDRFQTLLPWLLPATLLFSPVLESLSSSQKGTLCLLLFTATFALWQRGRNFSAGLVFGLLAFKPQLTIVIALAALWKRDWRFVAGGLATGAILAALSLVVGFEACADYVRFALGTSDYMQNSGYDLWKSHTIWGFGKLLSRNDPPGASNISLFLAGATLYTAARLVCGEWKPTGERFRWQYAGLVVASLLLSPHLFTYDLTIIVLPLAITVFQGSERLSPSRWQRANCAIAMAIFATPAISTTVANRYGVQITVLLLLIYLATLARAALASRRTAAGASTRDSATTIASATT